MLRITVTTLLILALYYFIIDKIFKAISKVKKSITIKYTKSVLLVLGMALIIYAYLSLFETTRELSKTLLQSGSLMIAVATFACQRVIGNVVSGFVIASTKPFEIGEKIVLKSTGGGVVVEGVVIDITARHTSIKQIDGKVCLVPNGIVDDLIVINSNTLENNGYPLPMFCSFDSDVEEAMRIMQEVIENHPLTINTDEIKNKVTCCEVADDGFKLQAIIWTKTLSDNFKTCSELRIQIFKAWKEAGIEIPYKTITLNNIKEV